jgi:hypothetical protein
MLYSCEFRENRCGEGRILLQVVIEILPHFLHYFTLFEKLSILHYFTLFENVSILHYFTLFQKVSILHYLTLFEKVSIHCVTTKIFE